MNEECQSILEEINKLRNDPFEYIEYLMEYIDNFEDDCLNIPDVPFAI